MKTGWSPKLLLRPDSIVLAVCLSSSKQVEPGMFYALWQALRCGMRLSDEGVLHYSLNISHYSSNGSSTGIAETKRWTERQKMDSAALFSRMGN